MREKRLADKNKHTVHKITFAVIGTGWRSEFYLRIARALPERLEVCGLVSRSLEKGAEVQQIWGIPTFQSIDDLLKTAKPSFLVVSVTGSAMPGVILEAVEKGIPVLSETPPAYDLETLIRLNKAAAGASVQVAEQYHLQPFNAARIKIAGSGLIGDISEATVSFSHGYHAVSILRRLMGIAYENATIRAIRFPSPMIAGPDRKGPPEAERIVTSRHEFALLDFGGRLGIHDFIREQHRSWIRTNRIQVRGVRGEISHTTVKYLKDFRTPVEFELVRSNAGEEGNLEGYHLKGILAGTEWIYTNPFIPAHFSDDEIAVASCLVKMGEHVGGGPGFYSLAEASQDAYLAILMDRAMETGKMITSETQPWAE